MSKLHKDIPRMVRIINIVEQYNNFKQLGAEEDIKLIRERINNLKSIKNTEELIIEFKWCVKMCNMYYDEIDSDFKSQISKEELERELLDFS